MDKMLRSEEMRMFDTWDPYQNKYSRNGRDFEKSGSACIRYHRLLLFPFSGPKQEDLEFLPGFIGLEEDGDRLTVFFVERFSEDWTASLGLDLKTVFLGFERFSWIWISVFHRNGFRLRNSLVDIGFYTLAFQERISFVLHVWLGHVLRLFRIRIGLDLDWLLSAGYWIVQLSDTKLSCCASLYNGTIARFSLYGKYCIHRKVGYMYFEKERAGGG